MVVKECPVDAIHTFQVRTLRSLGYRTRVVLANKSHTRPDLRTDYRVDLSVYKDGKRSDILTGVGPLAADARLVIECSPYDLGEADAVLIFHLVPERYAGTATADVTRDELIFLGSIQDHYVEYYRDDGCAAGVLYQTGPFNNPRFSPRSTTLIQAPKFYASSTVDSTLSLINASADAAYDRVAHVRCTLVGAEGRFTWTEAVRPFVPHSISMRDELARRGVTLSRAPAFFCLYAASDNATVIPLTILSNDETGAIGIEHSLPPDYYAEAMRGPARGRMMERLGKSTLFRERR